MEITFDAEKHIYRADGQIVPSVTTILQEMGVINYSGLPEHVRQKAMHRGTTVHYLTELLDRGEMTEDQRNSVNPIYEPFLSAWELFKDEYKFVPEKIEEFAFNPAYWYAGKYDRTGFMKRGKKTVRVLLDIKTGQIKAWTGLQLGGYLASFEDQDYMRLAVGLGKDGTYTIEWFDDAGDMFTFCGAAALYNWRKKNG